MRRLRALSAIAALALFGHAQTGEAEAPRRIGDKTLVAWVCLADLDQRGGSALTLIDPAEHFDAIVFGEVAPRKWMPGSDFFRRTHRDQSAWPAEGAAPDTLVQVAVVYHGKQMALYRNGKECAAYEIAAPQAFGPDAMVLIGLRYVGGMGEIGFLAGGIEDARIYDAALTAAQLTALRPNQLSDPKPLAWWSFEDGSASDAMGTFPEVRLVGATVANGRLRLDGNSYLWAARDKKPLSLDADEDERPPTEVQTMFYKARSKRTGNMWDTWLFLHDGTYYLYYLAKSRGNWDNISMARSPDGVHWTELGRVLAKGRGVTWMGTGSTWKSPAFDRDGRFLLNFSEWKGPRQTIFFAESKDLVHWTRLRNDLEFVQDERWYERNGRWDCIWTIPRPGGGLYGYWTATPRKETGGQFGFGESLDGVTWRALEPPRVIGVGEGEVGAIEKLGGRYYMMFGTGGLMVTLVADRPEGPFHAAKRNLRLLSGHTYFSRFFPTPDGVLVNHHSIARDGQVYFGTLKAAVLDAEGTLRLAWWRGNEKMKGRPIEVGAAAPEGPVAMLPNAFDAQGGVILEGTLALPKAKEPPRGLYIECGKGQGSAVLLDAEGAAELGALRGDGSGFKAEKKANREMSFGAPARFRLLLKGSLMEFYLDDILIECFSLPAAASGKIGLLAGGDARAFGEPKAWLAAPAGEPW